MIAFYSHHFPMALPAGHRFPVEKYELLYEAVRKHTASGLRLREAPEVSIDALARAHSNAYVEQMKTGSLPAHAQKALGLPWSKALYVRSLRSVGATLSASQAALKDGIAASLAGGTHHAKRDSGAGFCVFNDVAVASLCLLAERKVSKVLVLDCDVHQGDGTAEILNCDDRVFTFSMHARRNYPSEKVAGDLDIELEDNCSDAQYLTMLQKLLPDLFLQTKPDFVLYLAGADPYRGDRLGRLALSKAGLAARDTAILDAARTRRVPICTVMAGGYARNINDTVAIHATTVERALVEYQRWDRSVRG